MQGVSEAGHEIGQPILRASARTHSLAGIEEELARIWAATTLTTPGADGEPERRVGARTSVLKDRKSVV